MEWQLAWVDDPARTHSWWMPWGGLSPPVSQDPLLVDPCLLVHPLLLQPYAITPPWAFHPVRGGLAWLAGLAGLAGPSRVPWPTCAIFSGQVRPFLESPEPAATHCCQPLDLQLFFGLGFALHPLHQFQPLFFFLAAWPFFPFSFFQDHFCWPSITFQSITSVPGRACPVTA